jgi:hypothetical protein
MNTNLVLKLNASLLREARLAAADEGISITALLIRYIEDIVRKRRTYGRAKKRALGRLRKGFDMRRSPRSRDELHQRFADQDDVRVLTCSGRNPTPIKRAGKRRK